MLTRLVQAMRVGSHIPYRRSESHACRAGPWSHLGGRGRCCDVQATCGQFSVVSVAPLWGTQKAQHQPAPSVHSCLLHGGAGLHAAHLPLDQEPGPQPEEGALGPRGGRGVSGAWGLEFGLDWAGQVVTGSAPVSLQKLLQAVAKYGEQDWFKIREEVPGRSDAQCRDR